jgi:hypothetical protein
MLSSGPANPLDRLEWQLSIYPDLLLLYTKSLHLERALYASRELLLYRQIERLKSSDAPGINSETFATRRIVRLQEKILKLQDDLADAKDGWGRTQSVRQKEVAERDKKIAVLEQKLRRS